MTRRDPDPFQAGLIELLRDASVGHLALAAAAELLAAEHRMSWRFTLRELDRGRASAPATPVSRPMPDALVEGAAEEEEPSLELWENTAPAYLATLAALERFTNDRNEESLIDTLARAARLFESACVEALSKDDA